MTRLRTVTRADTAALIELFADPELGRFHSRDLTKPDQVGVLVNFWTAYDGPRDTGVWIVEHEGAVAGVGHLRVSKELPGDVLECGWYLARAHWGTDVTRDAARQILAGAGNRSVFALVHEDNLRGRRFTERLGFLDVGGGRHYDAPHRVLVRLPTTSGVHHVELWVADLAAAEKAFGWLFGELGWHEHQRWDRGVSWRHGDSYVVVEDSPARAGERHDRMSPGLNHLALHAGAPADVDRIAAAARAHGWRLMFADRHPYAGGAAHYAAYLENTDGFEVELVASRP